MIDALITHLTANTNSFLSITHAKDQKPVDKLQSNLPMLGIFPGGYKARPDGTDNIVSSEMVITALVHVVCKIQDWESLVSEVRAAVVGWAPGEHYTDMELAGGDVLSLNGGVIWWEERLETRLIVRQAF